MPPKSSTKNSSQGAPRYQRKDPISHCLERPDMYVGSVRQREYQDNIFKNGRIVSENIKSSPAILRIFIEILSNAIDNVERSRSTTTPCTTIKISICKKTGLTSVWNDGDIVPVEINEEEKCYNHTLIFGNLLTGSNYDDEEERLLAGRNGLGGKVCSIFSKEFEVRGCDPNNKKILSQKWTNNMRNVEDPKITNTSLKKGYTEVSWIPDFEKFGLKGYTDNIISLYLRHIYDAAMLSGVNVYYNDEHLNVKSIQQYACLYGINPNESLIIKTKECEVLVTPYSEFQTVSFVNGVYTRLGGQHVDSWTEAIFRPIVEKCNKKPKSPKINIGDIKQFFRLFVVARVVRPEFNGQEKEKLEAPQVEASVKSTVITKICKWSVMDRIEDMIRNKEMVILKKVEKKKKTAKIDGLDPANNSGGKLSSQCSLFICEGLSAKTYVVAGIDTGVYDKKGRDWFGILPVTGKVLNVRNSTSSAIADNKVVVSLIQTLGLRQGIDYTNDTNYKTLNYGRIILVADADVDGIHIEGLIINLLHSLFPTILQRNESFVSSMKTPIARVFIPRRKDLLFYDENNFHKYIENQDGKVNAKYYKGLGTTKEDDVPDTFGLKMIDYIEDSTTYENMNKIFHKKHTDMRKEWLAQYNPLESRHSLDGKTSRTEMTISSFLDFEMIKFSHADCARSIPNGIDGLKESQRKILYAVKKKRLKYSGSSMKVAQLSGYTAEQANYHHGEQNLQDTIVNMAQGFPGTNNIPLLYPDGGFGTRIAGGKDAASARYIYTKMEALTEYIYREEDEKLLTLVNDDGDIVQPEYYIPIIPMILVNGCTAGIGTGWSSTVPCYNPLEIIGNVREWIRLDGKALTNEDGNILSMLSELTPWYRGFSGEIVSAGEQKYITKGIIAREGKQIQVVELPVGMWTDKFKEHCEDLVADKKLKKMKNYSTTKDVRFDLQESEGGISCSLSTLKLHSYLYTSNLVLFDEEGKLRKYTEVDEIIDNFCKIRYIYYQKRKVQSVQKIKNELQILGNKERFITLVVKGEFKILNVAEDEVVEELEVQEFDRDPVSGDYDYLLKIPIRNFTENKIHGLQNDIQSIKEKLKTVSETSEYTTWLEELQELENKYKIWLDDEKNRVMKKSKKK